MRTRPKKATSPRYPIRPRNVLLAGAAILAASLLAGCGTSAEPDGNNVDNVGPTDSVTFSPTHKGGDPIWGGATSKVVENVVDNIHGVQVFGDTGFSAYFNHAATGYGASHIPFGTHVFVTCYEPNNTGQYPSVNGLYHITGGKWDGGWIPANTMLNDPKAKTGDTNTPDVDPRLKDVACK
ncbi:MAG TPA: hypothetical protein VJ843_01595 [Candidatus Saccharimonadales bacterium]|nr:hypothetical protein [Candidatus Saccharimonadales bacterium]